jgi:mannose-6-phosphate isomerase-like protein (cupin superfamily)
VAPEPAAPGVRRIAATDAAGHGWDDDFGGHTDDWVYADDPDACQIAFSVPPGGFFRHSNGGHDVWDRDILWRVVAGELVVGDPVSGEVARARPGDWLRFPGSVWLDGVNGGREPVLAVELTAPPRPAVSNRPWHELPSEPAYRSVARLDAPGSSVARLRPDELDWRIDDGHPPVVIGYVPGTRHLTAGELTLVPEQRTAERAHAAHATLYVASGRPALEADGSTLQLETGDGARIDAGTRYRLGTPGTEPAVVLFQVAAGR